MKRMDMKKLFLLTLAALMMTAFLSCSSDDGGDVDGNASGGQEIAVTKLTIRNQSFSDITEVKWNGVSFQLNDLEKSIEIGTKVTNTVDAGYGYIYFKRKSNPVSARTKAVITVEESEHVEFIFTDNTLIVEQNNSDNAGTLSSLNSTVVFWDDVEGVIQSYNKMEDAGYYVGEAKSGRKSIRVTKGGRICLNVNLNRKAKISFWHKSSSYEKNCLSFSIGNAIKFSQDFSNWWAFKEFDLEAGNHILEWWSNGSYKGEIYLDDILIVYTD